MTRGSSLLGMPEAAWGPEPRPLSISKKYPHVAMMQSDKTCAVTMVPDRWTARRRGASLLNPKCVRVSL